MRHHANFYTNRLAKEWLKNGKVIIACDLDDTIIPYNEEIKENCKKMVDLILECQEEGIYFLINTARSKEQLEKAKEQVESLGIVVHGVNEMHPEWNRPYGVNGKLYANIFLDDRGGFWDAYWTLLNALTIVKIERKNGYKNEQQS
jgi:MoaA/NifB/PqqE/SkfB family radical SAM enzyme